MKKIALGLSAFAMLATGTAYAAHHGGQMRGDTDNSGTISRAEAQAHASQMFDRFDANDDGKLDASDRSARQQDRRTRMFDALDGNNDGTISRDEFMAFDHKGKRGEQADRRGGKRMGHMRGHRGMEMFRRADTNNDGEVSKAEFTSAAMTRFDKTDTNNDGEVSRDERKAAFQEMRGKWREAKGDSGQS